MYQIVLSVHVPVALTCVPLFWIPIFAKKGGRLHVVVGRAFVVGMTFVALTGMAMGGVRWLAPEVLKPGVALEDLRGFRTSGVFFLYLGAITLGPVLHGWRIVRTRRTPERLRSLPDLGLLLLPMGASLGLVAAALWMPGASRVLFLALSPIGLGFGLAALPYVRRPRRHRMGWWYAHQGAMLGAGIAVHTAFAVFVVGRWILPDLRGFWQVLPWVFPSVIGVPLLVASIRASMRRFGDR